MIDSIRIKGFKKLNDISFNIDRFNVFIGANNSGKSSVLQAIQFAIGTAQTGSRVGTREGKDGYESFSTDSSSFLYLPLRELEALIYNKKLTQSDGAEITFYTDDSTTTITIKRGKNRNLAVSMTKSDLLSRIKDTQKPYCVYTPGLSGVPISEEYKTKAVVLKSATRGDSNLYLRNVLLLLKEKESSWRKFLDSFHKFFPDYSINVDFSAETDETIDVYVEIEEQDKKPLKLPIDALGTSALQIVQILSYVFYFEPPMLILDEPDTHLHPNNQRLLISMLDDISLESGMQVIIATHSRHIIDEAKDIASFFWMQNGQLREKIGDTNNKLVQVMLDLGALDVFDLSNPKTRWVICTEDARTSTDKYLQSILLSSKIDLKECLIIPYRGCSKIDNVLMLKDFIHGFNPNIRTLVHRDRDYLNDEEIEKMRTDFEKKGLNIWVTPGTDLESLFLNATHISKVYSDLPQQDAENLVNEVFFSPEIEKESTKRLAEHLSELDQKASQNSRHITNAMEIAEKTTQLFSSNRLRYVYGKKALGLLKQKIQNLHKHPSLLISSSDALYQEELDKTINDAK